MKRLYQHKNQLSAGDAGILHINQWSLYKSGYSMLKKKFVIEIAGVWRICSTSLNNSAFISVEI